MNVWIAAGVGSAGLLAFFLGLAAGVAAVRRHGRLLRAQQEQLEALRRDLAALCTGAAGSGSRLARLQRDLLRLAERQRELEQRDVPHRQYERARRLARSGADAVQVGRECGLPRAEAELLLRMRAGQNAAPTPVQDQAVGMRLMGRPT